MTGLRIDYSRPDAERRMRLLEMAGGDLDKAKRLESWVTCGEILTPVIMPTPDAAPTLRELQEESDDLAVSAFLRKA